VFQTIFSITGGAIYYGDFQFMNALRFSMYFLGLAIIITGVILLTRRIQYGGTTSDLEMIFTLIFADLTSSFCVEIDTSRLDSQRTYTEQNVPVTGLSVEDERDDSRSGLLDSAGIISSRYMKKTNEVHRHTIEIFDCMNSTLGCE